MLTMKGDEKYKGLTKEQLDKLNWFVMKLREGIATDEADIYEL